MKLTRADFRPRQRARFVPSPPRKKFPALRIAILVACGILVYLRFDDAWRLLRGFWDASAAAAAAPAAGPAAPDPAWNFASDSSRATLDCLGVPPEACDRSLDALSPGLAGQARALTAKARGRGWIPEGARASEFEAAVGGAEPPPRLLALIGSKGAAFRLRATADGRWCHPDGCLDPSPDRPPLRGASATDSAGVRVWKGASSRVFPLRAGRVTGLDSGAEGLRVTVYHGREIYAEYAPLRAASEGLRVGSQVNPDIPMGEAAQDTAPYAVGLRLRRAEATLAPEDLFPDPETGTGTAHGP